MAQKPTQERPFDLQAALAAIDFTAPAQARTTLAAVEQLVPAVVLSTLLPLLADCANPDAALNLFERLINDPQTIRLLEQHPFLIHYAVIVFANSQWLGETLIKNPDLLHGYVRERGLDRQRSREDFRESFARVRSRSLETDIALLLARFRRREYIRIMLRDLLEIAPLAETTAEISELSDVLIEEALIYCDSALRNRYGSPQHKDSAGRVVDTPFTVISMGKLGGRELNYSSDVDLLYVYGNGESLDSGTISNREYFVRLAQDVTEVLSRVTREGPVFRIDLRLRPQGAEGESAVALSHALSYYARTAHDWELQAMIKVHHSAGDQALAREFIRNVQPEVYRGSTDNLHLSASRQSPHTPADRLNFSAIETALDALSRMKERRKPSASADAIDVKLDRGGIRDIEFLVQCLQRVYGGTEPWLRSGGTLFSLQKLHDKNHISGKDFQELTTHYEFLRKVEHRLQLRTGQQTHRLPTSADELRILQRSLTGLRSVDGRDLVRDLRDRMSTVSEIYNRIIHHQQQQSSGTDPELQLSPLVEGGREQSYNQILSRLATDSPRLHALATSQALSPIARRNLYRFFGAACTSSERYSTVIRFATAVERAIPIFERSEFLTELLLRHPNEIATLSEIPAPEPRNVRPLFEPDTDISVIARDPFLEYAASASPSDAMALLRRHYRHKIFLSGARDVLEQRPAYHSLTETSSAADQAIAAAFQIASAPSGFAILALGRLGTREFDILSDADVLFVRDEFSEQPAAAATAERIVSILSAYTNEGSVFPVDPRLRPHGAEGELVATPTALAAYFATEAQAWEAITYTKLRFVAGDPELADRAMRSVAENLAATVKRREFVNDLREMRTRLERSASAFDIKLSPGGLYDIDFLASFLAVSRDLVLPPGSNLRARLWRLHDLGALESKPWQVLDNASELLRATEHAIRLVDGRSRRSLPANEFALQSTQVLVSSILGSRFDAPLTSVLRTTTTQVREVYESLLR